MGVYWRSYAGVISTEPEVIKQLIELVSKGSEDVTNVYDLTIDDNCILFHSDGYGCYGTDFEDARMMLFEFLFENYDKALVCFETSNQPALSVFGFAKAELGRRQAG